MKKPNIWKCGTRWICNVYGEHWQAVHTGYGDTPEDAYRDWAANCYL
jgi:hypothetical protein